MNERDARDAREALYDDLAHGRTTPKEPDTKARELGLEPLLPPLDLARFDPMREGDWTLAMILAWIAWGDLDRVRECMPRWRREHQFWMWREYRTGEGVRAGWVLETHQSEAPLLHLCLCEAVDASEGKPFDPKQKQTIHDARKLLWEALGADKLSAVTTLNNAPHRIEALEWAFLEHGESNGGDALYMRGGMGFGPRYRGEVLVKRSDVLRLWPAAPPTCAGEARAEKALRDACEAARQGAADWPKACDWKKAAPAQLNISQRGAVRVWGAVSADFPALASPAGKPKARRSQPRESKARRQLNP